MQHLDNFLGRLTGVRRQGRGWRACCPLHDDHDASFMVSLGEGNRILGCCHVCGKQALPAIIKRMGITFKDMYAKGRDKFVNYFAQVDRAPIALTDEEADLRNQAYSYLADSVILMNLHLDDLIRRKMDVGHIWSDGYFSVELVTRNDLGRLLLDLGEALYKVPGFYHDVAGRPRFASPGLFIPVRDEQRRIIAGQIRTGGDPKYIWCRGSGATRHVPLYVEVGETVWVTEGPLKADIASILSHLPVIAIPGVSAWKTLLPALKRWGTKRVVTAFDMDWDYNPQVKDQLLQFETALVRNGFEVDRAVWDIQHGKGLDDLLAAGFNPQIREAGSANQSVR